jgi:hypothetical protein
MSEKSRQIVYKEMKEMIFTKIDKIIAKLDEYDKPDLTWSDVGTINHVDDEMANICEFLTGSRK